MFFGAIALSVGTLTSCFKSRNCKCTTVYTNYDGSTSTSTDNYSEFGTKSQAEADCKANEYSNSNSTTTCELL